MIWIVSVLAVVGWALAFYFIWTCLRLLKKYRELGDAVTHLHEQAMSIKVSRLPDAIANRFTSTSGTLGDSVLRGDL